MKGVLANFLQYLIVSFTPPGSLLSGYVEGGFHKIPMTKGDGPTECHYYLTGLLGKFRDVVLSLRYNNFMVKTFNVINE